MILTPGWVITIISSFLRIVGDEVAEAYRRKAEQKANAKAAAAKRAAAAWKKGEDITRAQRLRAKLDALDAQERAAFAAESEADKTKTADAIEAMRAEIDPNPYEDK